MDLSNSTRQERIGANSAPLLFDKKLLNYQEAAKYLGISVPYLKKLKCRGEIPHVPLGKSIRFNISSLNRIIERKEVS